MCSSRPKLINFKELPNPRDLRAYRCATFAHHAATFLITFITPDQRNSRPYNKWICPRSSHFYIGSSLLLVSEWAFSAGGERECVWASERASVLARTPVEAARMQLCEVRRHAGCLTSQCPVARRKENSVKWHRKVTNNTIPAFSAFAI
jgi:hypothetical protein